MKKRVLAVVLTIAMLAGMMPATIFGAAAYADDVAESIVEEQTAAVEAAEAEETVEIETEVTTEGVEVLETRYFNGGEYTVRRDSTIIVKGITAVDGISINSNWSVASNDGGQVSINQRWNGGENGHSLDVKGLKNGTVTLTHKFVIKWYPYQEGVETFTVHIIDPEYKRLEVVEGESIMVVGTTGMNGWSGQAISWPISNANAIKVEYGADNGHTVKVTGLKAGEFSTLVHHYEDTANNHLTEYFIVYVMPATPVEPQTITVELKDKTVNYNGKTQSLDAPAITGGPAGLTLEQLGASVSGGTGVTPDEYPGTVTGPATYVANGVTYNVTYINATLTITGVPHKTIVVELKDKTVEYNGKHQSLDTATITGGPETLTLNELLVVVTGGTGVFVGDYPALIVGTPVYYDHVNGEIYAVTYIPATLHIIKATPPKEMTVSLTDKEVPYNGETQSLDAATITGGPAGLTLEQLGATVSGGTGIAADEYPATISGPATYTANGVKYNVTYVPATLTICPVKITVTITGNTDKVIYNGEEQSVKGYKAECNDSIFDESKLSGPAQDKSIAKGTDASSEKYMMGLKEADFSYNDNNSVSVDYVINDGWLLIEPAEITITVTGNNDTVSYNGEEQSVKGYTLSSKGDLFDESKVTGPAQDKSIAKGTDASEEKYPMGLKAEDFGYSDSSIKVTFEVTDGWLKIEPVEMVITVTGNTDEVSYNGEEQSVKGYTLSCKDELFDESKVSGPAQDKSIAKGTAASEEKYPMGLKEEDFKYNDDSVSVKFEVEDGWLLINPVEITVTVTGNTDKVSYNGEEQSVKGYTVECKDEIFDESKLTGPKQDDSVAKGTAASEEKYPMGLQKSDFSYSDDSVEVVYIVNDGWLLIEPVEITVTVTGNDKTVTYNGEEQSISGYALSCSAPIFDDEKVTGPAKDDSIAKGTAASTEKYMMGLKEEDFGYSDSSVKATFVVNDGWLLINPISDKVTVTITGHTGSRAYDSTALNVEGYDVAIDNENYTEADFSFSGTATASQTDVGKDDMGLEDSMFTNTNTNFSNVTFTVTDGYAEITPLKVNVTITGHNDTVDYDGEEHKVEGYDVKIEDAEESEPAVEPKLFYSSGSSLYKEEYFTFSGEAVAKGTEANLYMMGLAAAMFTNTNSNFEVSFDVIDGYLRIVDTGVDYIPTTAAISGTKVLEGRELKAGEFSFGLYEDGKLIASATNDAKGSFSFDAITYEETGAFNYVVKETAGDAAGVTYDSTEYTITVSVTDSGDGKLAAEISGESIVFTNSYSAEPVSVSFEGTKTLQGRALADGEFSFVLSDKDGKVIETVKNAADGSIAFSSITYTEAGEYKYTVKEVAGSEAGIIYDETVYSITVTVKDDMSGKLTAEVKGADSISFTNSYKTGDLKIWKTVTGEDGELDRYFSFVVKFDAEGAYNFDGAYTGTVKSGDTIKLKHGQAIVIHGLPAGTVYSVTENYVDGYIISYEGKDGEIKPDSTVTCRYYNFKGVVIPKTVDNSNIGLWIGLLVVAMGGAAGTGFVLVKKSKENR